MARRGGHGSYRAVPPHRRAVPHRHHPPIPWSHTAPAPTLTLTGARPPVHPRARPVLLDLALRAAPLRQAHRDAARPPLRPHLLLQGPLPLRSDTHVAHGCSLGCARLQPGVRTRLQPGAHPRLQPGRHGRHRRASHLPQGTSPCRSCGRTECQGALARSSPGRPRVLWAALVLSPPRVEPGHAERWVPWAGTHGQSALTRAATVPTAPRAPHLPPLTASAYRPTARTAPLPAGVVATLELMVATPTPTPIPTPYQAWWSPLS